MFSFFNVKTFSHISLPNCEVLLIMKVFLQKETRVWLQNCRQTDNKIERCKPTHLRLNWAKKGAKRNLSKPIVWISVCALNQLVIEKVAFDLIAPSRQQWPWVQYIFLDSKLFSSDEFESSSLAHLLEWQIFFHSAWLGLGNFCSDPSLLFIFSKFDSFLAGLGKNRVYGVSCKLHNQNVPWIS